MGRPKLSDEERKVRRKAVLKKYYQKHYNRIAEYERQRYQKDKERITNVRKSYENTDLYRTTRNQWRKENRLRIRSYNLVYKALKEGILKREQCVKCGKAKVEAHHNDYDKPLEVVWLCKTHHFELHSMMEK